MAWLADFSPFLLALLFSLLAGSATGVGAVPALFLRDLSPAVKDGMLGFGAGVMLAASFFSLLNPALEHALAEHTVVASLAMVGGGFLLGAVLFSLADLFLPHEHFIIGPEGGDPKRLRRIWLFVIAITLHNFPEGMAVGVGFGGGEMARGLALAAGIALQNMPEGLVVALALIAEGYRRRSAVLVALLTGLVEPVGGAVGGGLLLVADALLPVMLALAAGAMVYVISDEIIPETHRQGMQRIATGSLMFGFVVMMTLDVGLG